jgi:hypothetical protein
VVDHQKRYRVGLGCQHFWFVGHAIEFNSATSEGVSTSHHMFQSRNYRINYARSFAFHNKKDGGRNAQPTKNRH